MCPSSDCRRCGGDGYLETCAPDGSDEHRWPCACEAGDWWAAGRPAAADPHEIAATRARSNDFEATAGEDWT